MQINFECSGGFANLHLTYQADTEELPLEIQQQLSSLVTSSRVFELQPRDVADSVASPPDVFYYRLSLSETGQKISLSLNDATAPPSLHPLLALLRKLAIEQRLKGQSP